MEFFTRNPASSSNKQEAGFIYVGKESFHALAVALIDALKHNNKLDEASAKKIVRDLTFYFPKLLPSQPYSTTMGRIESLINNRNHRVETVDCLAYTLRQFALDIIYADPIKYQEVIQGFNPQTTKAHLRNSSTLLPVSALKALTQVIGITLILVQVEHGKEVRALKIWPATNDEKLRISLQLQVHGGIAFPKIKDKKEYANVGQMPLRTTQAPPHNSESETIAPLLNEIDVFNKRVGIVYEQSCKTLLAMVAAGELSKKHLIDLYVEFMPKEEDLFTNELFSKLEQKEKSPVSELPFDDAERLDIELLVDSLARWISTKQLDEDELFERIAPLHPVSKPPLS